MKKLLVEFDELARKKKLLPQERVYMSLWHAALLGVGVYEFKHLKTKLGRFLATGMILFHADAVISDALDCKSLSRYLIEKVLNGSSCKQRIS